MKRIYQLLAAAIVTLLVPLAASGTASAASTCRVGFTGPNSNNMCTKVETFKCTTVNNNTITIESSNTQTGVSGVAFNGSNSAGGDAITGTVKNDNGTVFNVTIQNPSVTDPTASPVCTATTTVTVPATETPTTTTVAPTSKATPAALPVTSGNQASTIAAVIAAIIGSVALVATGAAVLYRYLRG